MTHIPLDPRRIDPATLDPEELAEHIEADHTPCFYCERDICADCDPEFAPGPNYCDNFETHCTRYKCWKQCPDCADEAARENYWEHR